jgi:hypothetical protein
VQLVEIDPVGAEAPETVFNRARDVRRARAAFALLVDRTSEFRRDDRLVTAGSERASEKLLAARSAVRIRGVEQRDARVERGVDDALGRGLVDTPAEVVAPEADDRGVELADAACLHALSVPRYADFRSRPGS